MADGGEAEDVGADEDLWLSFGEDDDEEGPGDDPGPGGDPGGAVHG